MLFYPFCLFLPNPLLLFNSCLRLNSGFHMGVNLYMLIVFFQLLLLYFFMQRSILCNGYCTVDMISNFQLFWFHANCAMPTSEVMLVINLPWLFNLQLRTAVPYWFLNGLKAWESMQVLIVINAGSGIERKQTRVSPISLWYKLSTQAGPWGRLLNSTLP